ncbi:hypothetical protein NPIL_96661 [Nephila pilipes]|uniref:DDE Tnp4 domain-containing protein n=1 Tax=Nephila pilipes TaxID=299642 RepID=A0A8X6P226_NEPPI|nr:hypothetical protein NPIL_96661 [Nephila pilipes]
MSFKKNRPLDSQSIIRKERKESRPMEGNADLHLVPLSSTRSNELLLHVATECQELQIKCIINVQSRNMEIEYMPLPVRFGNKDERIRVDCTEFPIQKPRTPMEQQLTFRRHDWYCTKWSTISFISPLYCGSVSDKQLFIKSEVMDLS